MYDVSFIFGEYKTLCTTNTYSYEYTIVNIKKKFQKKYTKMNFKCIDNVINA